MNKKEQFIADRALTYLKKNKDYGNSADQTLELFGDVAYAVRLHDKIARIEQLVGSEAEVVDEKIEDTILDLVNYLCMYYSYETTEYRLEGFIKELKSFVENPHDYLIRLDTLLDRESNGKAILKKATGNYIADYITILTR